MAIKLGIDAKLYACAAGIGGAPSWTELVKAKNVTLGLSQGEADVSTRAAGWKLTAAALTEAGIDLEMQWDTADPGFGILKTAFLAKAAIGIAVMDGGITVAGSEGLWADCVVTQFDREEPLEESLMTKITLKPAATANTPQWKTIAA